MLTIWTPRDRDTYTRMFKEGNWLHLSFRQCIWAAMRSMTWLSQRHQLGIDCKTPGKRWQGHDLSCGSVHEEEREKRGSPIRFLTRWPDIINQARKHRGRVNGERNQASPNLWYVQGQVSRTQIDLLIQYPGGSSELDLDLVPLACDWSCQNG